MKYNVYLKHIKEGWYYSVDLGNLVHKGDIIILGHDEFKVIGGQCLPKI